MWIKIRVDLKRPTALLGLDDVHSRNKILNTEHQATTTGKSNFFS